MKERGDEALANKVIATYSLLPTLEERLEYFKNKGFSFEVVEIDFLDISSQMIRKMISQNMDIAGLTTYEVKEYIENNRIYKNMAWGKFV